MDFAGHTGPSRIRGSISRPACRTAAWLLFGFVETLRPEVCVEIGSARGLSACFVGLALKHQKHGKLYAIDPHEPTDWNDAASVDTYAIMRGCVGGPGLRRGVPSTSHTC